MREPTLLVRTLGRRPYASVWRRMRAFTDERDGATPDELWLLEHSPVFTLGQAGRREHILAPGTIPVVESDRGGQVTYHGPGQLVVYVLFDMRRAGIGVRRMVASLEQSVIDALATEDVLAERRDKAPGVYVGGRKVAALGLRVRHGCTYHGIALNVGGDITPFTRIDPCGYPGLEVTRTADLGLSWDVDEAGRRIVASLASLLGVRAVAAPATVATVRTEDA